MEDKQKQADSNSARPTIPDTCNAIYLLMNSHNNIHDTVIHMLGVKLQQLYRGFVTAGHMQTCDHSIYSADVANFYILLWLFQQITINALFKLKLYTA